MLLKAVLLDLDGVLLDTFRSGLHKIHALCAMHEVPYGRETRAKLTNAWGMPAIELLMHCLQVNKALATEMNRVWEKLDTTHKPQLIPGAREVLLWLRHNKFRTALITSRHRKWLLELLDEVDLLNKFDVVTAKEDCPYHKPDPKVFRYALEHFEGLEIGKEDCIFVGDTPSDTVAGTRANLETLVVQTGPYMIEHVNQYPVKLSNILRSIDDLPFWIEKNHEGELDRIYQ
jgi:HAD superfamily hydrolase (TIGR01509 family)